MSAYQNLRERLKEIHNINMAAAVLNWDQRTYMPSKGSAARASQLGTLARLGHEMFVARETLDLLAAAEHEVAGHPADSDERAFVRVARRSLDKATKVPTSLVTALTETCALAEDVWARARHDDDYAAFAPWLDKILHLKRQYAAAIGYQKTGRIYDALLDDFEEGMTASELDPLFEQLKQFTVPLLDAIRARQHLVGDDLLTQPCDEALQEQFSVKILKDCGYDFERGRLDRTVHPFCTNFSQNDVRITTRYEKEWLPGALFGCLHEMGHAFYEMNVNPDYEATPLGGGVSLGVHESQSRLWENLVGRSKPFWKKYFPLLQQTFPQQFGKVAVGDFYKQINRVTPSFIRVEADEVTYNLHIILRYEMENELLEQKLSVNDAPAAWNNKLQRYLGITPASNRDGILQDVHWSGGGIGYFPTYTLGNILAAQLFATARRTLTDLDGQIERADFAPLFNWLKTNVHQHGGKYPPRDLVKRVTGSTLTVEPYAQYLKTKFSEIYGI